ncbi:hypothetical protein [Stieleria maiorica]|uniref:hypothetical protein n=1 Tax=Stieleria maiorica TaxID=2795974 RepID=UPI0011C9A9B2|nr:hypothetical protein [Stieleria maiorica]
MSTPVRGDGGVEAYVAETLKKYQSAHEDLVRNGYACMATGLLSQPPHNGDDGRIIPSLQLTCERADFTTYVSSNKTTATFQSVGGQAPFTRPHTRWAWETFNGKRVKVKPSPQGPATEMPRTRYTKRNNPFPSLVIKHDPFVDWLWPSAMNFTFLPRKTISQLRSELQFVSARELGSGQTEAVLRTQQKQTIHQFKIVFSKAHNDMPIDVQITVPESNLPLASEILVRGRYEWKLQKGLWLPRRIEFAYTSFAGREVVFHEGDYYLAWKLGKEIPKHCFDFDAPDPIEPLATLFQLNYQDYSGKRVRETVESEWELPSELQAFAEPTQQE